jgi:predicted RNA binding protein YcfA (HicA-like mRNA interferase family)
MSSWPATRAKLVLAALLRIGWTIKRQSGGSHKVLARPGWQDFVFAFHDGTEIGPAMLARIARHTGLSKKDL